MLFIFFLRRICFRCKFANPSSWAVVFHNLFPTKNAMPRVVSIPTSKKNPLSPNAEKITPSDTIHEANMTTSIRRIIRSRLITRCGVVSGIEDILVSGPLFSNGGRYRIRTCKAFLGALHLSRMLVYHSPNLP